MKKALSLLSLALAAAIALSGCSEIQYETAVTTTPATVATAETSPAETTALYTDNLVQTVKIKEQAYSETYQLEGNTTAEVYTALDGYDGEGYIQLTNNNMAVLAVTVPTSQFYKITAYICSADSVVTLITGNSADRTMSPEGYETVRGAVQGAYYVSESIAFNPFVIDGVYLKSGLNYITLQCVSGIAYLDKVTLEKGSTSPDSRYNITNRLVTKNPTLKTLCTMNYLVSIYGKKTLTGQYVTPNTNTEINAIYSSTARYPAIRCSDLSQYSIYCNTSNKDDMTDLDLAVEWAEKGGLVSYSWQWYAPSDSKSHYYSVNTDFNLDRAVTERDISMKSVEELEELYGKDEITKECYSLILDIDNIAEKLGYLAEKDVTVLFRPLMEGGNSWYWWGGSADSYKWLWRLLVNRLTNYHGLNNLIWVWNGENSDFYPGDEYCDIIGEDIYNPSKSTNNPRFMNTRYYSVGYKGTAMTECAVVPSPDDLYRDNAMWLWFAVWRGDYIINADGSLSTVYNSLADLKYAYNHELFVTRDELPDMSSFGIE